MLFVVVSLKLIVRDLLFNFFIHKMQYVVGSKIFFLRNGSLS